MPFMKHVIEPINVSQCPLPPGEPNELECLSNLTLANVIRQLSSLGQHAGRIFDELAQDAHKINGRAQVLHQRIDNLKSKCAQLDIQNEEVSLADFQHKKQFKSSIKIDQQVVSRKTMPDAMRIMYNNADPPPALDKLNPYRTDGKDCMKFYTDPEFFFNIWCNELIKDNETRKIEKKRRRTKNEKQQHLKSPPTTNNNAQLDLNHGSNNSNSNIGVGIMPKSMHVQYDEATAYYQQQLMLLNHGKQLAAGGHHLPPGAILAGGLPVNIPAHFYAQQQQQQLQLGHQAQHMQHFAYDYDDDQSPLPPPPPQISTSHEVYAESSTTKLSNGARATRLTVLQQKAAMATAPSNNNERPVLPPPPIPNNQLSDLQQIQQQMIRKKLADINIGQKPVPTPQPPNNHDSDSTDLPPPPSPPHNGVQQNLVTITTTKDPAGADLAFDMPLPPPPIELQEFSQPPSGGGYHIQHHHLLQHHHHHHHPPASPPPPPPSGSSGNCLPPPPPLPPLVESDTASSSSSISINQSKSNPDESKVPRNCYLDDITKRRYQLRSTQRDTSSLADAKDTGGGGDNGSTGGAGITPFVNNSDVAAIIDFIRKFRPHVRDSSDDDEENSDWDD